MLPKGSIIACMYRHTVRHASYFCLLLFATAITFLHAFEPSFAKDPSISPDGDLVCFVYQSDLWLVPFKGGDAKRLTATSANEWNPLWSPDGKQIAFVSDREGLPYIYTIPAEGGEARVIIRESYSISDWFADGTALLGSKFNHRWGSSLYKIPIDGSRPQMIAEIGHPFASLSPDNKKIIFNRRGDAYREAYQGSINGELWEINLEDMVYTRLTNTPLTERYPRYSHFGSSFFYCGSDGNVFQLYRIDNMDFSQPFQLSKFDQWSARDISIARQNDRIVFERFDEIWRFDPIRLGADRVSKLQINIPEDSFESSIVRKDMKNDVFSFALSDDELLIALQYQYDLFATPRKGGEVKQLTFDHASVEHIQFFPGSKSFVVNRLHKGINTLFMVSEDDFESIKPISWFGAGKYNVDSIVKDASNKWIISYTDERMSGRIAIGDSTMSNVTALNIDLPVSSNFAISPDMSYAIYAAIRSDIWIYELYLYDFASQSSRKILNDTSWIGNFNWLPDQKSILMTRNSGISRLDFVPRDDFELEKDHWQEIFKVKTTVVEPKDDDLDKDKEEPETKAPPKESDAKSEAPSLPKTPLKVQWEDIEKRVYQIITSDANYLYVIKVIDDSTFYYIQDSFFGDGSASLKKANIYGKGIKEEFNIGKNVGQFRMVKNKLYYLENGIIKSFAVGSSAKAEVKLSFEYKYDQSILDQRVFEQVWGAFGLNFYDAAMHGKNWQEMYDRYQPYVLKARSIDDIAAIVNEMIGDVNASHTGFYPRQKANQRNSQVAALGVEFDHFSALPEGIRIREVFTRSRLYSLYGIRAGDILTHIDGIKITAKTPLDSLLTDKIKKRIKLKFRNGANELDAQIDGLSRREENNLYYQDKVAQTRQLVNELSSNRLGYVHIPAMGSTNYDAFIRDVFRDNADKEALVIDVRGNSGGRIHDQLITFLIKKHYGYSSNRRHGMDRKLEPRRIWNKPTIVLVDEGSFSDGEIFPIIYQELKLGKVVGMPSSGSVIGTWQYDLLDGSSMRMPGSGWYKLDGTNMEGSGAMPDILVDLSPNDIISNNDVQLKRAIQELLQELN